MTLLGNGIPPLCQILCWKHTNTLLRQSQYHGERIFDILECQDTESPQTTFDIPPNIVGTHNSCDKNNCSQCPRDPVLEQPFSGILYIPVAPLGEYATDGVVDLGIPDVSSSVAQYSKA